MDKNWPVFIDETAILYDHIEISAGKVGVGVLVSVEPLVALLGATLADLTG
jgi:Cys-tRNA(Pro)/Cys-tRNA(Cys) deacylase